MTKKKKILALEQQVKNMENKIEKSNKMTLVATGTVAATSVGAVILSLVVKKKSANDIDEVVSNVNKLINVISTSNVITTVGDGTEEDENEDDDSSKQSKVQITGSFSGPEFKSQINALAEFLSNINFEDGYKFNARALKDIILSFIPEIRDDEVSIVHISPSFLSDSEICGKDGLHFFIYAPKCKIKVRIDEEGVTIKDVTK